MQKEVADTAAISEWTVLRAEGGASVRPPTARKIADALGVSVADLLERPPVPLASAPSASPSPDVEATEVGQRNGGTALLLDDPRIGEWLRENDLKWGATDDEAFAEHVRGLDLAETDEDGRRVAVMELVRALTDEHAKAKDLLWIQQSNYRSLGLLLSVDPDAPVAEQKQQRRDQLSELRKGLNRRYRRRAHALERYAELLARLWDQVWRETAA
jgi:hypothetical protein